MGTYPLSFVVWTAFAIACYALARSRGATNAGTWAVAGLLFGPFGLLLCFFRAAPGSSGGTTNDLEKLATMRAAGTISSEEYGRQVSMILAQPSTPRSNRASPGMIVFYVVVIILVALIAVLLPRI